MLPLHRTRLLRLVLDPLFGSPKGTTSSAACHTSQTSSLPSLGTPADIFGFGYHRHLSTQQKPIATPLPHGQ